MPRKHVQRDAIAGCGVRLHLHLASHGKLHTENGGTCETGSCTAACSRDCTCNVVHVDGSCAKFEELAKRLALNEPTPATPVSFMTPAPPAFTMTASPPALLVPSATPTEVLPPTVTPTTPPLHLHFRHVYTRTLGLGVPSRTAFRRRHVPCGMQVCNTSARVPKDTHAHTHPVWREV